MFIVVELATISLLSSLSVFMFLPLHCELLQGTDHSSLVCLLAQRPGRIPSACMVLTNPTILK